MQQKNINNVKIKIKNFEFKIKNINNFITNHFLDGNIGTLVHLNISNEGETSIKA